MHAWFAVFSTIHSRILLTECASESLYSVQNIAIHRIRLIFDSSNTLVYRLGPNQDSLCDQERTTSNYMTGAHVLEKEIKKAEKQLA